MANCETCGAVIDWAVTAPLSDNPNTRMPIDHDSANDPAGTIEVWKDNGGTLRYRPLKRGEAVRAGRHRGVSHFVTCPDRDRHRKPKRTTN